MRRKAEVLAAIKGGLLSIEEACDRYDLSLDEIMMWERTVHRSGIHALRVTKLQYYRRAGLKRRQDQTDYIPVSPQP